MEAATQELALRYLLELSTDIRLAVLLNEEGALLAGAPEHPSEAIQRLGDELVSEARKIAPEKSDPIEIDVAVDGGAVFLVREEGQALLCLTGPFALPGLILHDMRIVLNDLRRGAYDQ